MKRCPECNRTYADDTIAFCLADGSLLSAPYNPDSEQIRSERAHPPPTEILSASNQVPTIASARPMVDLPYSSPLPATESSKRSRIWLSLALAILILVIIVAGFGGFLVYRNLTVYYATAHKLKAFQFLDQKNFGAAEEEFRQAVRLRPTNWEHRLYLANTLMLTDKKPEAEMQYRESIKLGADPSAYCALANCLDMEGKHEEAAASTC